MKLHLKEPYRAIFLVLIIVVATTNLLVKGYARSELPPNSVLRDAANMEVIRAILLQMIAIGLVFFAVLWARIQRSEKIQDWLVDTMNWNIERLKADDLERESENNVNVEKKVVADARWPWGKHHTETLGHLEAAAKKWWVLYDASDITTAPTNDMVSQWLQDKRGVSREKAKAIASMLRPDGLPTGPRR